MKTIVTIQVFLLVFSSICFQEEVLSQSFYPGYGGAPIVYDNPDDDDIGLLLTILLLAGRNRNGNCNCCNCCNCGNTAKTIPIPYPIPFPTNNPIIYKSHPNDDDDDNGDGGNGNNGNNSNNGNNGNNGNNNKNNDDYYDYKDNWSHFKPGHLFNRNMSVKFEKENDVDMK